MDDFQEAWLNISKKFAKAFLIQLENWNNDLIGHGGWSLCDFATIFQQNSWAMLFSNDKKSMSNSITGMKTFIWWKYNTRLWFFLTAEMNCYLWL